MYSKMNNKYLVLPIFIHLASKIDTILPINNATPPIKQFDWGGCVINLVSIVF